MTTKVITRLEYGHYYHYVFRNSEKFCCAISSSTINMRNGEWLFSMMPDFVDANSGSALANEDTYLTLDEFVIIALRHMQLVEGTYEDSTD